MRVLWFTNVSIAASESKGSGSWLFAMRDLIKDSVDLFSISEGDVQTVKINRDNDIQEYIIPSYNGKSSLPPDATIKLILSIVDEVSPDIIHIWGVEKYWISLFEKGYCQKKYILEVQGLLSSCAAVFWGGLTNKELNKCNSLKDLFFPSISLRRQFLQYVQKGARESEIFSHVKNLSVQSIWTRNQLRLLVNPETVIFDTLRPIRNEFYVSRKWSYNSCKRHVVFTSFSYSVPFKGLHVIIKAVKCLVTRFPDVELRIAGKDIGNTPFYRRNGYDNYLLSLIKDLNLERNIVFLDSLNASSLVEELLLCNVFVNPSFVESYSASAAEAMYLGVPSVLSYAGALPDFSREEYVAMYYSPLDYADCASKISLFFDSVLLSHEYSSKSISVLSRKCDSQSVKEKQLSIYESVING